MKKSILTLSLLSIFSYSAIADDSTQSKWNSGVEVDQKFRTSTDKDDNTKKAGDAIGATGLKLFTSFDIEDAGTIGASYKRAGDNNELNLNYTHGFENFWVKGEIEDVYNKDKDHTFKAGLGIGTSLGAFDLNTRYRRDSGYDDSKTGGEAFKDGSKIDRFDFGAGTQLTENVYLKANLIDQTQRNKSHVGAGAKDNFQNFELRATFGGSKYIQPYVEIANEGNFANDKREDSAKIGFVLPF
ncbi:hypothetical protein KP803_00665 [Vibrio sp. ZSDE26]|uniref:Porin n=1 Tax=Vibrio amylolyticus TaxID=2847292 RepID=A0A9X1XF46_9VIBR|nr:hypothetical protein [Vibrio amylolyticus]MCK6261779.1 hypothetical protein [Vibrio amylolyticus]